LTIKGEESRPSIYIIKPVQKKKKKIPANIGFFINLSNIKIPYIEDILKTDKMCGFCAVFCISTG